VLGFWRCCGSHSSASITIFSCKKESIGSHTTIFRLGGQDVAGPSAHIASQFQESGGNPWLLASFAGKMTHVDLTRVGIFPHPPSEGVRVGGCFIIGLGVIPCSRVLTDVRAASLLSVLLPLSQISEVRSPGFSFSLLVFFNTVVVQTLRLPLLYFHARMNQSVVIPPSRG
jgi:hypothetical protein